MGWFGGSSGGDTAGTTGTASKSDTLDLSEGYSNDDNAFASKKRQWASIDSGSAGFDAGTASSGEFQQRIQMEQQKLQLTSAIHRVTEVCWDTCADSSATSSSLGSRTETCLTNCAGRFIDTTLLITNRFVQLAQKMR